jgi:RNA polymerase primary sigma factor
MASEDIQMFIDIANKHKTLNQQQERELLQKIHDNPKGSKPYEIAMDKLIKHNLALVIKHAKKYTGKGLDLEDLLQEGWMGLLEGINKFDIKRTHEGRLLKLSTYVTWWIRQRISRAIANTGRTIRIPIHILAEYTTVQKLYGKFVEENEYYPSSQELSELYNKAMDIERETKKDPAKKPSKLKTKTAREISDLGRLFHPVCPLDEPNSEDENLSLMDYMSIDDSDLPEERLETKTNNEYLRMLLNTLNEDDRIFIMYKFGMLDGVVKDRKLLAKVKKLDEQQVEEKEKEILKKLKSFANKDKLNL